MYDTIIELSLEALADSVRDGLPNRGVIDLGGVTLQEGGRQFTGTGTATVTQIWFVQDPDGRQWHTKATATSSPEVPTDRIGVEVVFSPGAGFTVPPDPPLITDQDETIADPHGGPAYHGKQNFLPLFGRLLLFDRLEKLEVPRDSKTVTHLMVNFVKEAGAPMLVPVAPDLSDTRWIQAPPDDVERDAGGRITSVGGPDPRVLWVLDESSTHFTRECHLAQLWRVQYILDHPLDALNAAQRFIEMMATRLAEKVSEILASLLPKARVVTPETGFVVDPASTEPGVIRELAFECTRHETADRTLEQLTIRLLSFDPVPPEHALPEGSSLVANPTIHGAITSSTWSQLRQSRAKMAAKLGIADPAAAFEADEPFKLGPDAVETDFDGNTVELTSFEVRVVDSHLQPGTAGRLQPLAGGLFLAEGGFNGSAFGFDYTVDFTITNVLGLDDVPRDPKVLGRGERVRVEADAQTNRFMKDGHGLVDGTQVIVKSIPGEALGEEFHPQRFSFVTSADQNTFQLASSPGGTPIDVLTTRELFVTPALAEGADVEIEDVVDASAVVEALAGRDDLTDAERVSLRSAMTTLRRRPRAVGLRYRTTVYAEEDADASIAWWVASLFVTLIMPWVPPVLFIAFVEGAAEGEIEAQATSSLHGMAAQTGAEQPLMGLLPAGLTLDSTAVRLSYSRATSELDVTAIKVDPSAPGGFPDQDDPDYVIQIVEGTNADDASWRISVADAVLFASEGSSPLKLFVNNGGARTPLSVKTSSLGRRYLSTPPDAVEENNLARLPRVKIYTPIR